MDAATLREAERYPNGWSPLPLSRYEQLLPGLLEVAERLKLVTVNRMALLLAECGEEAGGLQYTTELASGAEYNGRTDLGNIHPGDGERFKGRTFIQTTGRGNYGRQSEWMYLRGEVPTPTYFVDHPEALSLDKYVWTGPEWYWSTHGLNGYADRGDIRGASYIINGGDHGMADRIARWNHCRSLGQRLLNNTNLTKAGTMYVILQDRSSGKWYGYAPGFWRLIETTDELQDVVQSRLCVNRKDILKKNKAGYQASAGQLANRRKFAIGA